MAKYKYRNHHNYEDDGTTIKSTYQDIEDTELKLGIPMVSGAVENFASFEPKGAIGPKTKGFGKRD